MDFVKKKMGKSWKARTNHIRLNVLNPLVPLYS